MTRRIELIVTLDDDNDYEDFVDYMKLLRNLVQDHSTYIGTLYEGDSGEEID